MGKVSDVHRMNMTKRGSDALEGFVKGFVDGPLLELKHTHYAIIELLSFSRHYIGS